MEDRRSTFRSWAGWPVKIITSRNSMEGEVVNASGKGAFIQCQKPLNAKNKCRLIMKMPKGRMVETDAEVVWSSASGPDDESRPRGMGVRFLW